MTGWLLFTAPLAVAVIAVHADHIPGLRALVDGTPPGPPPYSHRTECDDSWLRELPANQEDQ